MARGQQDRPKRIVFSPKADLDISGIHTYSAHEHGVEQADHYIEFLLQGCEAVAADPTAGSPVVGRDGVLTRTLKWPKATYGHMIVFRHTEYGIYVLRVFHTAMDWMSHI